DETFVAAAGAPANRIAIGSSAAPPPAPATATDRRSLVSAASSPGRISRRSPAAGFGAGAVVTVVELALNSIVCSLVETPDAPSVARPGTVRLLGARPML